MRKEATLEQWSSLYNIAIKIKDIKPWEKLSELDLLTVELSDEELVLVSVTGKSGGSKGILTYIGLEAIYGFGELINSIGAVENTQLSRYQDSLVCKLGTKEDLKAKEVEIIEKLNLDFSDEWIYFRSYEKNFVPAILCEEEVLQLTEIFEHIYASLLKLKEGLSVDFESGKTLMRKFDKCCDKWVTVEGETLKLHYQYPVKRLSDDELLHKLSHIESNGEILELDIAYLANAHNIGNMDREVSEKCFMLANMKNGSMLVEEVFITENDVEVLLNSFIDYIMENKKPKAIVIRDNYIGSLVYDICDRTGIEVYMSKTLKTIDKKLEELNK